MQDMYHDSGFPNNYDGRCTSCPFRSEENCNETEEDVKFYIQTGYINRHCPFITK